MSNWFLELSRDWDIELGCDELESLGDTHDSLPAAWAGASDQVRLWLCARFAETHAARLWCLGTTAACVAELLESSGSIPSLDVFRDVLEPMQRADQLVLRPGLTELADAMVHYHEVPRLLLVALQVSEKIDRAPKQAAARIQRAGRAQQPGEIEASIGAGVLTQRARFARTLVEAYRAGQAAFSNWGMSRGLPFARWGTDRVRSRHRCAPDGASIEPVSSPT